MLSDKVNSQNSLEKSHESQSEKSSISRNPVELTKTRFSNKKALENSFQTIIESNAEEGIKRDLKKKQSLPSINFYEYAGQKSLCS